MVRHFDTTFAAPETREAVPHAAVTLTLAVSPPKPIATQKPKLPARKTAGLLLVVRRLIAAACRAAP